MNKFAQNKQKDPVQEKLRQNKRNWNSAAKEFIKRLIAFKKGINGRGDNALGLPPGNIKDPLPPEVIGFLSEITSNFQQLSEAALEIGREQEEYSRSRRKPMEKTTPAAVAEVPKAAKTYIPLLKLASRLERVDRSMRIGTLILGPNKIENVLLAESEMEQMIGLMYREAPLPIMAFPYSSARINSFWMKDVSAPLDLIFSFDGKVVKICKGEPHSTRLIGGDCLSDLVVELPYGTCKQRGIDIGDNVSLLKERDTV